MIHRITIKIIYRKAKNQERSGDYDLLRWILLTRPKVNWVKFIIDQIMTCKANKVHAIFYTSMIQATSERNNIIFVESGLLEAPKMFNDQAVSQTRYHRDENNIYFCYQDKLCMIYEDKFVTPKEAPEGFVPCKTLSSSSNIAFDQLTPAVKAYFGGCVDQIITDA